MEWEAHRRLPITSRVTPLLQSTALTTCPEPLHPPRHQPSDPSLGVDPPSTLQWSSWLESPPCKTGVGV